MLRFAGFGLDRHRAELRRPTGEAVKLRPKALAMLTLFLANPGRVLSKQELMDAVWPNVHVGEDSLFQCIRELRAALGDDQRQLVRVVSGRGYLFEAEVSEESPTGPAEAPSPAAQVAANAGGAVDQGRPSRQAGPRRRAAVAIGGFVTAVGLAFAALLIGPSLLMGAGPPVIAVMPMTAADDGGEAMAAAVTTDLADGLSQIDNIRLVVPQAAQQANFVVNGEISRTSSSWELRARMTRTATGEVVWATHVSAARDGQGAQQSRLAAGVGYPLALRINALVNSEPRPAGSEGGEKVVIEQATAALTQTSRERFGTSQAMLEKALAANPDNVDLAVALAAVQLRGVQMVWYSPAESATAQANAGLILQRALRLKPTSIPILDAYCRFLNATNEFTDSLVVCARTLNFNPWHGPALNHIGLAQLQLGRFEDALASFEQADRYGTPQVSRWTWQLSVGMTYLVMGRSADALPWLEASIAITPASGRSHMLLSAAYMALGRPAEAQAAMEKGMALRPGSNLGNVILPTKNASPVFIRATEWIAKAFLTAGLPET